ncbi:MAG: hypothetical protein HC903_28280 [Methylacidiphilales bacterium]|nr:hypothetical protein [Candidatus Methylacidiphilales bacterium]NJR19714.1 hypothetical protein [Calothrix sp. CSU_2_0]
MWDIFPQCCVTHSPTRDYQPTPTRTHFFVEHTFDVHKPYSNAYFPVKTGWEDSFILIDIEAIATSYLMRKVEEMVRKSNNLSQYRLLIVELEGGYYDRDRYP